MKGLTGSLCAAAISGRTSKERRGCLRRTAHGQYSIGNLRARCLVTVFCKAVAERSCFK